MQLAFALSKLVFNFEIFKIFFPSFFKFPLQTLNFPGQNDRVEMEHRFEICTKIADFIMKRWKEMGNVFLIRSLDQDNCINEMEQTLSLIHI